MVDVTDYGLSMIRLQNGRHILENWFLLWGHDVDIYSLPDCFW